VVTEHVESKDMDLVMKIADLYARWNTELVILKLASSVGALDLYSALDKALKLREFATGGEKPVSLQTCMTVFEVCLFCQCPCVLPVGFGKQRTRFALEAVSFSFCKIVCEKDTYN
jgi:hypothetical protein